MIKSADDESFLVERLDGVLKLSFNRPDAGNAIPSTAVPQLTALFTSAQEDRSIRCILIRGEGKVFSAGGDVAGFARSLEQDAATRQADFTRRLEGARRLVESVLAFDRPIVAAVRGAAAGAGIFYPLVADCAIGDETANFVFAHQRIALTPDAGLSIVLPQVVGVRMARMLVLTSARVDAQEALRLGMLNRVVDGDDLEAEALKLATRLARSPQYAAVTAKRIINATPEQSVTQILDAERDGIVGCVGDPDFDEGIRAFLEKRTARFPSARD